MKNPPDPTIALSVLIVEDEVLIAEELQDRLTRLGYEILGIRDTAEKAIHSAKELRPNLVLMDIHLKGKMDGIEAAGYLRREMDIPVVFLTAHSDQATLQRAKETAPFGYVLKPFQERDVLVAMEIACNMHRLEQRLRERSVELEQTVTQLQKALQEVRALRGILPLCAWCNKIREGAEWYSLENYLRHTAVSVTHGICPDCMHRQLQ